MRRLQQFAGHPAVQIFLWSRAAIWIAALFALVTFESSSHPARALFDSPIMHEHGLADVWARWDSVAYLGIAQHGYEEREFAAAFFPLYPSATGVLGRVLFGHYVTAGVLVSLTAALCAFLLLYRLAEDRFGREVASRSVLYLAIFPMSFFLQAVYSESLYLALALGAFLLAERGRFPAAAGVTGLALLTRPTAFALLPALAVFAWRAPQRWQALAALAIAPAVFLAEPLLLWAEFGDPLAFVDAQGIWHRELATAGPIGGLWDAVRTLWDDVGQLAHQPAERATDVNRVENEALRIESFAYLCAFIPLTVLAWRRLGSPYGLYAVASLAIPLSFPADRWPLLSLQRFGLVVFPYFIVLALIGARPRLHSLIVGVSSLLLGVAVVRWALWQFVA